MDKTVGVIFFVYNFSDNTTSANRYKSITESFARRQNVKIKVFELSFYKQHNTLSCDLENSDSLSDRLANMIMAFTPKMTCQQKLIYGSKSRYLQFLYQILYNEEVSSPRDFSIMQLLEEFRGGYIIVSGGPYGIFKYAAAVAKKLNSKLILDYRDPWTFGYKAIGAHNIAFKLKKSLQMKTEKRLIEQAAVITTVSESLKKQFPAKFHSKIHVIPNGSNYSEQDIRQKEDSTFNIVYIGTIYDEQLKDDVFFTALQRFLVNKDVRKTRLYFLGSFYNHKLKEKIKDFGLSEVTTITRRLKREELLPYLNGANIFLHLRYGNKSGIITSKNADYLFFRKAVLLPISDNGDMAESILKNKAGYVCNTIEENLTVLEQLWDKFQQGESPRIEQSEEMLRENSREVIAEKFVGLVLRS